ncbi:family 43 glycosylhydrolase [Dietzia sp. CH92]|uniref:family 43 glycosylhydrolase n=1 Tax=Dietzia sp. CH92 TaxID=3051823 RepID=UPI0028CFFEA1|nr:family 43 glycosylhydrolase [Dietzia sp. CH92]
MTFAAGARSLVAASLVVVVTIAAATGAAAPALVPTAAANPVISSVAPDPTVVRGADGAFHVYATSDDWADGAGHRLIPHFRSFDLVEWEYLGDAFTTRPRWAPLISFLWAPDVHVRPGGEAVMYYTTGGSAPCIGRATAPGVEGPWGHDARPVVCFGDYRGELLDPMDPEVVFTEDGPVLLMGNFEGIHAVPMNDAGTELEGEPVLVAGPGVEAPAVIARDGHTHLFTSAGLCCDGERSQYRVLGGRADDLFGPYADRSGRPLLERGAGDVILRGDENWVGPGHVDVATDDAGQDWMVYHAAPRGQAVLPGGVQRRYLMLDRLDWVGGWPVVGDGTPSEARPADPVVDLPVRLTAAGDAALRRVDDDEVLDLPVRIASTGAAYTGELRATVTGPDKRRASLPIVAAGGDLPAASAAVAAGGELDRTLTLRPSRPLAAGRHEVVVSIGLAGGPAQEIAVFGLEVAPDGSLSLGSGALGSVPFGS